MKFFGTILGKLVAAAMSLSGHGGQAMPGLIVESLFPRYVTKMLTGLPDGVAIITGTNGKTTTTKIVAQLLRANGKKVLTNPTGSNLVRGIASALSQRANWLGRLDFDIAVLEVDEATVANLVKSVRPDWLLALNVSRDQLDRYGEIDHVAKRIGAAMAATKQGVVVNAGDPSLLAQARSAGAPVSYFGISSELKKYFPTDYELAAIDAPAKRTAPPKASVKLSGFSGQIVSYEINDKPYKASLELSGQHNFLNGAAALALVSRILPSADPQALVDELAKVPLAFGRGQTYKLGSGSVELVLVKNPASFTQALASYKNESRELAIFINDNIADGRDVSWLWDVNFDPLTGAKVRLTSGTRAADMALRLSYSDIKVDEVESNVDKALAKLADAEGHTVILATYTAMLRLHAKLSSESAL